MLHAPDAPVTRPRGDFRWVICGFLFLATTINYMDRQILGLLKPTLDKEIGWSETEYANIVTAFQAAYAIGLLGFGAWIDRVGSRLGYAAAVALWSAAAMAHALARSVLGFGAARAALGAGEAGNFPAAIKVVAEWFPPRQRSLATGIFNSGSNVGAIVAPLVVPWVTTAYGWQTSFVVLGGTGFVWVGLWYALYRPAAASPRDTATPPLAELPRAAAPSWLGLLAYRQTWAFVVGTAFTSPIWWFYLYWLPGFFNKRYGLDLVHLGLPLVMVYSMTCAGSMAGGWLSSHLLHRGWPLDASRKTALLTCAVCVVPVIFAGNAPNLWVATLLIGLAAAAHQGWSANLYTLVSDMFPKESVASVVGLGTMFGAVAAIGFAQLTGKVLEKTGEYWSLFAIAGLAYLVALGVIQVLVPRIVPIDRHAGLEPD
jgi:ACS family hexuronate transporter-like MFS transporter